MGYDLTVASGRVKSGQARQIIDELLSHANQLELDVLPVHVALSGRIHHVSLPGIADAAGSRPESLPVCRPIHAQRSDGEVVAHQWHSIEAEIVQGVVLFHHYEPWSFMWNLDRNLVLADYLPLEIAAHPGAKPAKEWAILLDDLLEGRPARLRGDDFSEKRINLHCPWRRSDVAAACDALAILSTHCEDFVVRDEYGIWPDKDFSKWHNLASKFAKKEFDHPLHPDPTDQLG